jgi:hypothetical protein
MLYGTKQLKNGKVYGYLEFEKAKKIVLHPKQNQEFSQWIRNKVDSEGFYKETEYYEKAKIIIKENKTYKDIVRNIKNVFNLNK